jgi:hypothetical protein
LRRGEGPAVSASASAEDDNGDLVSRDLRAPQHK